MNISQDNLENTNSFPKICDIIPHRYPFLLIDKIIDVQRMKSAIGQKNVSHNEYFFQGHYPNYPVMPGVLIMEALAQLGAYLLLIEDEFRGKIPLFRGMDKVKFRKQVLPGDILNLKVELIKFENNYGTAKAVASVDGKKCAQGELSFFVQ